MADQLRPYDVTVNGHTARLQLSEDDARAYGDAAKPAGDAGPTASEETVQPAGEPREETVEPMTVDEKSVKPRNKARTTE